jgi:hypothetical protein
MNITDSIAKQIGGEIEIFINENPAIQFYANYISNSYLWTDTRFEDSSDIWLNKQAKTRIELIEIFKEHLLKPQSP